MMTEEFYRAICHDDDQRLADLMEDKNPQDLDGFQIWPGRSRRMTSLQLAVREGSIKCAQLLIDKGINIDYGAAANALTTAIDHHQVAALKLLLDNGCDVNKPLVHGYMAQQPYDLAVTYAIDNAISCSELRMLQTLLLYGANPLVEYIYTSDFDLVTPLARAARKPNKDYLKVILHAIPDIRGLCRGPESNLATQDLHTVFASLLKTHNWILIEMLILQGLDLRCDMVASTIKKENLQQNSQDIQESIDCYISNVLSLKQMCRLSIRKNYKRYRADESKTFLQTLDELPIPNQLLDFVKLKII